MKRTRQVFVMAAIACMVAAPQAAHAQPKRKNGFVAFTLSVFIPTSGQFYNGEVTKGILGLAVLGSGLAIHFMSSEEGDDEALLDPGLVIVAGTWMWSMFDAPISSSRINRENGYAARDQPRRWDVYTRLSGSKVDGAGLLIRF